MRVAAITVFLLPLILYFDTAAPDLTFIDSGELAAVACTLGVAHPTGYPLFTLTGRLIGALPAPSDPVQRLTLLSALWVCAGTVVMLLALRRLLPAGGIRDPAATWGAMAASLTLATAATVWSQAVVIEVYALGFLFVALLFWLAIRAGAGDGRDDLLLAYVAGLAVANHGSAAPLVPALALPLLRRWGMREVTALAAAALGGLTVLALPVRREIGLALLLATLLVLLLDPAGRAAWRRLAAMALASLTGLSVYLYLPIRSGLDPLLDWGDPTSVGPFLRHITGKVYHVWFLSSWDKAAEQLALFGRLILFEMTPVGCALMIGGVVLLWLRHRLLAQTTVLVFALNLLYAVNYDIHDIETYFIPAIMMGAVWLAAALGELAVGVAGWVPRGRRIAGALVLALPITTATLNHAPASQRDNYLVRDYVDGMFASLEPGAVLLSRQWDTFCSAALYEQAVRGRRPDVTIIEKELLRRTWYIDQLARWDPELVEPCRERLELFRTALEPFELDRPYDAARLQELYIDVMHCLLETGEAAGRPIYVTPDARTGEPGLAAGYIDVPIGLAMRLYRELPDPLPTAVVPPIRGIEAAAASSDDMRSQLAALVLEMMTRRALLEGSLGRYEQANRLLEDALAIDPDYRNARIVLRRLQRLEGIEPGR